MARRTGPQAREKNAGWAKVVSSEARSGPAHINPQPAQVGPWAGPQARIKKIALVYINYFFMDSCINVSNSCIIGKDKYYVFFNVLKFKEYIVYVIV